MGDAVGFGWTDVAAVSLILLAVLVAHRPILAGEAYLWGDFPERVFPLRQFGLAELAAGRLPFWAPNLFAGVPFLAMIDSGILYPPTWTLLPFVEERALSYLALEVHTLAHLGVMGVAAYLLCRSARMGRAGAFVAGLTWVLSGPVLFRAFHPALLQTLTWMPVVLACLMRAFTRGDARWSVAAAGGWMMALLAGHPQGFLYIGYAVVLTTAVYVIAAIRAGEGWVGVRRVMGPAAVALAIGTAAAAPAILPALELAALSERTSAGLAGSMQSAPDFRHLTAFLLPDLYGRMSAARWDYWGPGRSDFGFYWESYVYVGILPVILAAVGAWAGRGRMRAVLVTLAGFSLLGIVGAVTPVPDVLRAVLPGFELFRAHSRLGIVWSLCLAGLAGLGVDALTRSESDASRERVVRALASVTVVTVLGLALGALGSTVLARWLAGSDEAVPLAAAGLSLYGSRGTLLAVASLAVCWLGFARRVRGPVFVTVVVGLVVGDLWVAAGGFNGSPVGPAEVYPDAPIVRELQARTARDGGRLAVEPSTPRILPMNAGIVYGLETPFDGLASPLLVAAKEPPGAEEVRRDLMNVTHVLGRGGGNAYALSDRPSAMPRAWVARRYVVASTPDEVAARMAAVDFDHRTMVTLDREPEVTITQGNGRPAERARVIRREATVVEVDVELEAAGLLVLSELHYPGWMADVDGEDREVLRADGVLRAVALPAGRHRVRFTYRSRLFTVGLWIAAAAWLSGLALVLAPLASARWPRSSRASLPRQVVAGGAQGQ